MEKKKIDISQQLFAKDKKTVTDTIKKLRDTGTDKELSSLVKLFATTDDDEIKRLVSAVFTDLKNQSSTKEVVRLIKDSDNEETMQMLISSCWQTRLDYADYFETFIDIVIEQPFQLSFEAFTLIENFENKISDERKKELIDYIKSKIGQCKEENLNFAMDMIKIIEKY